MRLADSWRSLGHDVRCLTVPDGSALDLVQRLARRLDEQAASFAPDILFAGGQSYALPFMLAKRRPALRRVPFAMKLSNTPYHPDQPILSAAARQWLRTQALWTDRFAAPDAASWQLLARIGIAAAQRAVVANPAADAQRLDQLHGARSTAPPLPGFRMLSVGRLAPQKNVPLLIEAFARIARKGDRLTIVGNGPLRGRLQQQIDRHDVDIRLAGQVDDPAACFAEANAFALASDYEGLPAVLVEALAAGLPIAATDSAPGIKSLLGTNGLLVPVRDPAALARAMDRLRGLTPDRAAMMTSAARFTVQRSAPAYVAMFETMLRQFGMSGGPAANLRESH